MSYFLIVYDRTSGRLVDDIREFNRGDQALKARFDREVLERSNPAVEVVVLGAADREALEATHGRYFGKISLAKM